MDELIYVITPVIESVLMSKLSGYNVYLKLENTQPSGSFKLRGLSNHCKKAVNNGCKHLLASSGGNAGLAVAYTGRHLQIPVTIVVPQSTSQHMVNRIEDEGAKVIVHGKIWNEANEHAKHLMESGQIQGGKLIHPFDHPAVWQGHSTMIIETADQLKFKPDVVVASVGGGGLLSGILEGMHQVGWQDIPVVAMETNGADSFSAAVKAGELVTIPGITSVAKCLGATRVAENAFNWTKSHKIISEVVEDKEAVHACLQFLDDHKMLVGPACGAALASIYSGVIRRLEKEKQLIGKCGSVLIIVCGGLDISINRIFELKSQFNL